MMEIKEKHQMECTAVKCFDLFASFLFNYFGSPQNKVLLS